MRRTSPLKPQDILILLKLLTLEATPRVIDLAVDVGVSPSEISHGLERLVGSQLL
jgi:predicted transcriptional regulator